jgi:(1->4)-alpha-D-glucan 1-alpha-D-glucosylmutase
MRKALREAKIHSSWINPNKLYEDAVDHFIRSVLDPSPDNRFLRELTGFVDRIKAAGMWNSLSQTVLKIASPGVPDLYQGNEIWDFSLVDPDNRRPVDFLRRRQLLQHVQQRQGQGARSLIEELTQDPGDGAIKMYITSRAFCFRKSNRELMAKGSYIPLRGGGARQQHVISFARAIGRRAAIAVAGRFFMALDAAERMPTGAEVWSDTALLLRRDLSCPAYRDVFSQHTIETAQWNGKRVLPLAEVFAHLPVALLEGIA